VLNGYVTVYATSATLLTLAALAVILLRLDRRLRSGSVRSPWSELGQVNADQIIF
jgi:hypothetical protein